MQNGINRDEPESAVSCGFRFGLFEMTKDRDNEIRRCPRLGGPVSFSYCMEGSESKLPCWKVIDCWWEIFDVKTYLKENLPEEDFRALLDQKPKSKIESILELIEKAKNR
jgi:hypothetical protein